MDKRKPWFKFYSRDWRSSARLRLCSFAARGLWADLLSLMHESIHRGFLLVEGVVPTVKQLASLLGGSEKDVRALLAELKATKVYSVTGEDMPKDVAALVPADMPKGVLVSRRMVRDEEKARKDKANGSGGGNPILKAVVKIKSIPVEVEVNPQGYRSEVRDHSSESSSSRISTDPPRDAALGVGSAPRGSGTVQERVARIAIAKRMAGGNA